MIDIHNHILIDVDDGPKNDKEAVNLLKQGIQNGVSDVIVTPHHYSGSWINHNEKMRAKLKEINALIDTHQLDINVYPGQEIRMNQNILKELQSDEVSTLNNSKYILIELPFNDIPKYTDETLNVLQEKGYVPVIAHPERCKPIVKQPDILYHYINNGAIAQVTASSVTGDLGKNIQKKALEMIHHHLVHVVASDAHSDLQRPFMLQEAYQTIEKTFNYETVKQFKENAKAILNDREIHVDSPAKISIH